MAFEGGGGARVKVHYFAPSFALGKVNYESSKSSVVNLTSAAGSVVGHSLIRTRFEERDAMVTGKYVRNRTGIIIAVSRVSARFEH